MKILIVDDETQKLGMLIKIIKEIPGVNESDIQYVLDIYNGKRCMSSICYDLLILDINMPENIEEAPSHEAGVDFLYEILYTDSIMKPREIVILTAYDESCDEVTKNPGLAAFSLLKYSPTSTVWANVIKSKINYALIKECSELRDNHIPKCDIGIITAVPVETNAVNGIVDSWSDYVIFNDPTLYRIGELKQGAKSLYIVHAQQSEMGMSAAAALTTKMALHFTPKYLFMVGIAAGIGNSCKMGDIIVPGEVWNYSSGKYTSNDCDGTFLLPDPKNIPLNPRIKELVINNEYSAVLARIKSQFPGAKPSHEISINTNPMACGSAVVASEEFAKEMILSHSRKTCGLDMESYGFFYSAHNVSVDNPIPICVKSVCDYADKEKCDQYQSYAAFVSAQFTKHFILDKLHE